MSEIVKTSGENSDRSMHEHFSIPHLLPGKNTVTLSPVSAAILTATILDFTQGNDANIEYFARGFHMYAPQVRMDKSPDQRAESAKHIAKQAMARAKSGTHKTKTRYQFVSYGFENFDQVAEEVNTEKEVSPNEIYARIIQTFVQRDINYIKGRPGENSTIKFKTCMYLLEQGPRRVRTVVEPINELLSATIRYLQQVTLEDFLRDAIITDSNEFVKNLITIVNTYNETKSPPEQIPYPPFVQNSLFHKYSRRLNLPQMEE